jgi:triacylglycerol lipase
VVFLPVASTAESRGAQRLAASDLAARATPLLKRIQHSREGPFAFYYVACTPLAASSDPAELALAGTTLGWPSGSFIVLRDDAENNAANSVYALDRLRWLFARSLDLHVINFEPSLAPILPARVAPEEDRAPVRHCVGSDEDCSQVYESVQWPSNGSVANLRPTRSGLVPRYPVVFCHGMLAFTTLRMELPDDLNCFSPLRAFLRERGFRVLFPQVMPTGGVAARAEQLRSQILRWTDEPINLVAHSMGGLDARYMISHLGMGDRVQSLTTIATPHRGTYLVDWFLANFRQRVPLLLALEAFGVDLDGFRDCRPTACQELNAQTPDSPRVRYFSYGGAVSCGHVTPVLRRAWSLLNTVEGPNDGMVSMASARWGEYLGTLAVDHFAQTPDMTFVRPGENFDALGFYFRLLENLARRGF